MGNTLKKRSMSSKSKTSSLSNPASSAITSAAPPSSGTSKLLIVGEDEYMKLEIAERIRAKVGDSLDGKSISSIDYFSEPFMFYGGRGGFRPLRRAVDGKLEGVILAVNLDNTEAAHLELVRVAVSRVSDGEKIPLLVLALPSNEASKAAKKKREEERIAAEKRRKEIAKKNKLKNKKLKKSTDISDEESEVEETNKNKTNTYDQPMDKASVEALLNEKLNLTNSTIFSVYKIFMLPEKRAGLHKDEELENALKWLKNVLNGNISATDATDLQPPAIVKRSSAPMPIMTNIMVPINKGPKTVNVAANANTETAAISA